MTFWIPQSLEELTIHLQLDAPSPTAVVRLRDYFADGAGESVDWAHDAVDQCNDYLAQHPSACMVCGQDRHAYRPICTTHDDERRSSWDEWSRFVPDPDGDDAA